MGIARVFFDVSMANNFDGLREVMRKAKLNPDRMKSDEFTIFVNRRQNAFKLFVGTNYLVYHKNGNRRFPLEAIQYFPRHFDGKAIDFDRAVETALMKKLLVYSKPKSEVLK